MKIRTKVISLLALLFAGLLLLEVAIQDRLLMPSFSRLEREDASTSMKRIDVALDTALEGVALSAADWGNWADVYHFVQSPTPAFVAENITPVALRQLQVDALLILDARGSVMLSSIRDPATGAPLDLDVHGLQKLGGSVGAGSILKGFVGTTRGPMMVAAAPVLNGSGRGKPIGLVIMGRLVTRTVIHQIGAQAQAALSMVTGENAAVGERIEETAALTVIERAYADLDGRPLMSFRVEVPRKITQQGRSAVAYATLSLIGAGIAVLIGVLWMLNKVVLKPLARVTRHAEALGDGSDLSGRLRLDGNDEMARLAREFDGMVERLEISQRQLVDQSFQAGFAELAKGVLHNLGNAMTPLGVRVAQLNDRLRQVPVEDLALAVDALDTAPPESARAADLKEFLRLGCAEVAAVLNQARSDLEVVTRQSAVVQSALSELMTSTRNDAVVESVRLPDLVAQALEIVPDACRHRLRVEADESLRRVGPVQVARTVLRLVLQNLVINAADAVRDAGRERGILRVTAQIVREENRAALHLQCADDGIGIPSDHLERVFEQGFSTKSRATNHGIGLHWCANAVASLGGRIWAASEGTGRGASMHLVLPLAGREGAWCP